MLPYGTRQTPHETKGLGLLIPKAFARQHAAREIATEIKDVALDTYQLDGEAGLISHCASCDFLPCCCVCPKAVP